MNAEHEQAQCDVGGYYWYPRVGGPAVYREPCSNPPTHRWRGTGFVDGHWAYRCAKHVGLLSAACTVEPLAVA